MRFVSNKVINRLVVLSEPFQLNGDCYYPLMNFMHNMISISPNVSNDLNCSMGVVFHSLGVDH